MFELIKHVIISSNNEPCMIRSSLIDLDLVELKYYPFMISLYKCSGSCNSVNGAKDKNTFVFGNAGDEKKLHQVDSKFIFLINLIEAFKSILHLKNYFNGTFLC